MCVATEFATNMHVDRARPSFLLGTADVFAARHLRIPFHIQHDRSLWQAGTTACRAIVNGTLTAQPTIVKLCIKSLAWFKNYSQQEVFYWLKVALRQLCGANKRAASAALSATNPAIVGIQRPKRA